MTNIKRLQTIREFSTGAWQDGGDALDAFVEKLSAFTDDFPAKQEELRDAVADADAAAAAACVGAIRDMLFSISADSLASDCMIKINEIPNMSAGSLEAYAEGLLGSVSALSVDIQMAIYGEEHIGADAAAARKAERTAADEEREIVILAVDDNAFFLNTIKSYLQGTKYKLTCVNSGSVALRFLEKHTPDLFVLDIDMPEMNGYELADKIHARGITAPIIFLTGNASKDYVIRAVKAGAADFIIKPISKEQALEKIAKYV